MKALELSLSDSGYFSSEGKTEIMDLIREFGFEYPRVEPVYGTRKMEIDPNEYEPWLEGVELCCVAATKVHFYSTFEGITLDDSIKKLIESLSKKYQWKFELKVFEDGNDAPIMVY